MMENFDMSYTFVYDFDDNTIYVRSVNDHLCNEIEITNKNYMEINYHLVKNGNFNKLMFLINGLLLCSSSNLLDTYNSHTFNRSLKIFNWVLEKQCKFDSFNLLVPELDFAICHYCFYLEKTGLAKSVEIVFVPKTL